MEPINYSLEIFGSIENGQSFDKKKLGSYKNLIHNKSSGSQKLDNYYEPSYRPQLQKDLLNQANAQ